MKTTRNQLTCFNCVQPLELYNFSVNLHEAYTKALRKRKLRKTPCSSEKLVSSNKALPSRMKGLFSKESKVSKHGA